MRSQLPNSLARILFITTTDNPDTLREYEHSGQDYIKNSESLGFIRNVDLKFMNLRDVVKNNVRVVKNGWTWWTMNSACV
jgi:hypothetical protein